ILFYLHDLAESRSVAWCVPKPARPVGLPNHDRSPERDANPLLNPEKYQKFGLSIPNGILLYGPPGCGKTFIVKKLAEELRYHLFEMNPSLVGMRVCRRRTPSASW